MTPFPSVWARVNNIKVGGIINDLIREKINVNVKNIQYENKPKTKSNQECLKNILWRFIYRPGIGGSPSKDKPGYNPNGNVDSEFRNRLNQYSVIRKMRSPKCVRKNKQHDGQYDEKYGEIL